MNDGPLFLFILHEVKMLKLNKELTFCTHPGRFHLDEILSIALILKYHPDYQNWDGDFKLEQAKEGFYLTFSFVTKSNKPCQGYIFRSAQEEDHKQFKWVIDTGEQHDPDRLRFDHHQWIKGNSACMLIFNYLKNKGFISEEKYSFLYPYIKSFSSWDTGETIEEQRALLNSHYEEYGEKIENLSNIVGGFNRTFNSEADALTHWSKAFGVAFDWLVNKDYAFKSYKKGLKAIGEIEWIVSYIVFFSDTFIVAWKELLPSALIQVAPGSRKGEWGVTSVNSKDYPLIEATAKAYDDFIFFHSNAFYTCFKSKASAISYAREVGEAFQDMEVDK